MVLDNIDYQGNGEADPGDVRGNNGYEARISKQQLRWLEQELKYVDTDGLFSWQPMLRWAARIAVMPPTAARDFSNYWQAG